MQRVQTYIITKNKSKEDYDLLSKLCHNSKNLYNYVNYVIRQAFTKNYDNIPEFRDFIYNERFISEYDLSKRLCQMNQVDYRSLKSQVSQQVISQVFKNYKAFFRAINEYKKNKSKFNGFPKLPKYKDKNGKNILIFTNQSCSFDKKDWCLKLDRKIKLRIVKFNDINDFQQVRIVPKNGYFQIEVVFNKLEGDYTQIAKQLNKKTTNIGIDIGVDNLATITSDNSGLRPLIINGRSLKSINQFYNKQAAKLQQCYSKHKIKTGAKFHQLALKRSMKISDYMHKVSRRIVDYCISNNVKTVYVGHNNGWKSKSNIGKINNQTFVQIPFNQLISKLQYKLNEVGIQMELVNEAYTSMCSSLDTEDICKHETYIGKRITRGLFKCKIGQLINADVNGSLNILRQGLKHNFEISKNVFNPIRLCNINEINNISIKQKSVDRGCVFQPYIRKL